MRKAKAVGLDGFTKWATIVIAVGLGAIGVVSGICFALIDMFHKI